LAKKANFHYLLLRSSTSKQHQKLKSSIVNSNDRLFSFFDSLYYELSLGFCLVDKFSNCFSFHIVNCRDKVIIKKHLQNLNKIVKDSSLDPETVIIIFNTSLKNNITTSISHIDSGQNILAKIIHSAVNITSTETKLFAIKLSKLKTVDANFFSSSSSILGT